MNRALPHIPLPRRLAGVVFDCDGVLIDSRAANMSYYNRIRELADLAHMSAPEEEYAHMHSVKETLLHIFPQELHWRLGELAQKVDYERDILPLIRLEPDLRECLESLRARNVPLAVFTNRGGGMGAVLDAFHLRPYFDMVMTVADAPPKPAPDGLLRIAENWRHPPEDLLFVGDSLLDLQAAEAAGACFVAYRNRRLKTRGHVESFLELKEALREISLEKSSRFMEK